MGYSFEDVFEDLDSYYYKTQLSSIYSGKMKKIAQNHLSLLKKYDVEFNAKKSSIEYLQQIIVSFIVYDELRELWLKALSPETKNIINHVAWWGDLNQNSFKKLSNETIIIQRDTWLNRYEVCKWIKPDYRIFCFQLYSGYNSHKVTGFEMTLPDSICYFFKKSFEIPKEAVLQFYDSPEESGASIDSDRYSNEEGVLSDLPLSQVFNEQKLLKVSKQGKLTKAVLRKMNKVIEGKEFYTEPEDKNLQFMQTHFLALITLLTPMSNSEKKENIGIDHLILLYKKIDSGNFFSVFEHLMTHIKGRHHIKNLYDQAEKKIHHTLLQHLKKIPQKKWLAFENWQSYLFLNNVNTDVVQSYSSAEYLYYELKGAEYSYQRKKYLLTDSDVRKILTTPFLESCLFLYASLGWLELAYKEPVNKAVSLKDQAYLSIYDGLQSFRLTDMGAYIFGITKSYTAKNQDKNKAIVILDSERLLITFHGKDKLKASVLNEMTHKVGSNRYKMDYESFLNGCFSYADIENKIVQFKKQITKKPPAIWEDFFTQVLAQSDPFTKKTSFEVIQLSQHKPLYQLIATDTILKKYVLKAEDFHILIERENLEVVRKRLLILGYCIFW